MGLAGVLLFLVQPMLAKFILPGSAAARRPGRSACCSSRRRCCGLCLCLCGNMPSPAPRRSADRLGRPACLCLPITPAGAFKPLDAADPTFRILALSPSASAPLMPCSPPPRRCCSAGLARWSRSPGIALLRHLQSGSFLGLLTYPFIVEPFLSSLRQTACGRSAFTSSPCCPSARRRSPVAPQARPVLPARHTRRIRRRGPSAPGGGWSTGPRLDPAVGDDQPDHPMVGRHSVSVVLPFGLSPDLRPLFRPSDGRLAAIFPAGFCRPGGVRRHPGASRIAGRSACSRSGCNA